MNTTNALLIVTGICCLLFLSLLFEKAERKSRGKGTWLPDRWLLRMSGFVLGAAYTLLAFAVLS